jgi:hypothetical protein
MRTDLQSNRNSAWAQWDESRRLKTQAMAPQPLVSRTRNTARMTLGAIAPCSYILLSGANNSGWSLVFLRINCVLHSNPSRILTRSVKSFTTFSPAKYLWRYSPQLYLFASCLGPVWCLGDSALYPHVTDDVCYFLLSPNWAIPRAEGVLNWRDSKLRFHHLT